MIQVENNATNVKVRTEDTENGTRVIIEPMEEQIELSEIKLGEKFKVGEYVFKAIKGGYILDGFLEDAKDYKFGNDNDYTNSDIRKMLNSTFYDKLAKIVGEENILKHDVDLTSMDGLKEYGTCRDNVSLLTEKMYKDNREYLKNMGAWWWLATPYSTKSNDYSSDVCCVRVGGTLGYGYCGGERTVRPFIIFASTIFVSKING